MFDVLIQFATVFLGAYLAFAAEQLRERRATRERARSLLRQLVANVAAGGDIAAPVEGFLAGQLAAIDVWMAGGELDEAGWQRIADSVLVTVPDLGALLRGEPITVMPASLTSTLARLEGLATLMEGYATEVREARERVIPLWATRTALSEADARLVGLYRAAIDQLREGAARAFASTGELQNEIAAWV